MPHRAPWTPDYNVGHEVIDAQHRGLLAQCDRLADLCPAAVDDAGRQHFDQAVDQLMTLARAHFATEAALLAELKSPDLDEYAFESDEFEYLANEIATAENFDRLELQRFFSLWWLGHIVGSAGAMRELLAGLAAPAVPRP